MKTIFVHMGLHKTGSTSIQVFLTKNRKELKKSGILYPSSCCPESARFGHHIVPWVFMENESFLPLFKGERFKTSSLIKENYINSLKAEIYNSGLSKVVISSEEFDSLNNDELENFFREFKEFKIVPIVFLRNYADFLQSSYQTSVTYSGYTETFAHFCNNQRSRLDFYDWLTELNRLSHGNAFVINFDDPEIKAKLINKFISLIGISADGFVIPEEKENTSLSYSTVEVIRFFNLKKVSYEVIADLIPHLKKMAVEEKKSSLFSISELISYYKKYNKDFELFKKDFDEDHVLGNYISQEIPEEDVIPCVNLVQSLRKIIKDFSKMIP